MFMLWGRSLASAAMEFIDYDEHVNPEGWVVIYRETQSDLASNVIDEETVRRPSAIQPTTAHGCLLNYPPGINLQSVTSNIVTDDLLDSPSDLVAHHKRGSSEGPGRLGTGTEPLLMDDLSRSAVAFGLLDLDKHADVFGETEHNSLGTLNNVMLELKKTTLLMYQQDQRDLTWYQSDSCSMFGTDHHVKDEDENRFPGADGDAPLPFPKRHIRRKPPKLDQDLTLMGLTIPIEGITTLEFPEWRQRTTNSVAHVSVEGSQGQLSCKVSASGAEPQKNDDHTIQRYTIRAIMLAGPNRTVPGNRGLSKAIDRLPQLDDEGVICDVVRPTGTGDGPYNNAIEDQVLVKQHRPDSCESSELSSSVPGIKILASNEMAESVPKGSACSSYHVHDHWGAVWPPDKHQNWGHDDPWSVFSPRSSKMTLRWRGFERSFPGVGNLSPLNVLSHRTGVRH